MQYKNNQVLARAPKGKSQPMRRRLLGLLLASVPLLSQAAPIYDFTSAPILFGDSDVTVGFVFTTNTAVNVSSLGYYDDGQNGLNAAHDIGIYNLAGTLLTSATVSAGVTGTLDGKFRYVNIPTFILSSGQSYIIAGATTGVDGYTYGHVGSTILGLMVDPTITIGTGASVYNYAAGLNFPTNSIGYDLYPMVNFNGGCTVNCATIPEPSSLALLGLGLAGFGWARLRKV